SLRQRRVDVPQIRADQGAASRVSVGADRLQGVTLAIEPAGNRLLVRIELASGDDIRASGGRSGAVVDSIVRRRGTEWRTRKIRVDAGQAPVPDHCTGKALALIRQFPNSAQAEIVGAVEIRQSAVGAHVRRIYRGAAAIEAVCARSVVDRLGPGVGK